MKFEEQGGKSGVDRIPLLWCSFIASYFCWLVLASAANRSVCSHFGAAFDLTDQLCCLGFFTHMAYPYYFFNKL